MPLGQLSHSIRKIRAEVQKKQRTCQENLGPYNHNLNRYYEKNKKLMYFGGRSLSILTALAAGRFRKTPILLFFLYLRLARYAYPIVILNFGPATDGTDI